MILPARCTESHRIYASLAVVICIGAVSLMIACCVFGVSKATLCWMLRVKLGKSCNSGCVFWHHSPSPQPSP